MKLFLPQEYSKSIQISREYSNCGKSAEIKGFPNYIGSYDSSGSFVIPVTRARLMGIPGTSLRRMAVKNGFQFRANNQDTLSALQAFFSSETESVS